MTEYRTLMEVGIDLVMGVNTRPILKVLRIHESCRLPGESTTYRESADVTTCSRCNTPVDKMTAIHIVVE